MNGAHFFLRCHVYKRNNRGASFLTLTTVSSYFGHGARSSTYSANTNTGEKQVIHGHKKNFFLVFCREKKKPTMLNSVQLSAINDLLGNNRKIVHIKNDIVDTTKQIRELENLNKHRTQSLNASLKDIAEKNQDLIMMYKRHQTLYNSIGQISKQTHEKNQEIIRTIEAVKAYREGDKDAYTQTKEKIAQGIKKNIKAVNEANEKLVKAVISTNIKCDPNSKSKTVCPQIQILHPRFTATFYRTIKCWKTLTHKKSTSKMVYRASIVLRKKIHTKLWIDWRRSSKKIAKRSRLTMAPNLHCRKI
jgi:hypothetical protein